MNRRRHNRITRLVSCACSLLVLAGLSLAAGPAAQASTTNAYNVWLWNVAGDAMHHGSTTDGMVSAAVSSIVNRDADFVAFNEICRSQYNAVIAGLRDAGWPADPQNFARFSESLPASPGLCAGTAFGNAIFSAAPLAAASSYALPADGRAETKTLLCAPLQRTAHVRFCTTHITTVVAYKAAQLDYVLGKLDGYRAAGDTVLIAGDLNSQPDYSNLAAWHTHYRELDDNDPDHCLGSGEWTATGPPGTAPACSGGSTTCTPTDHTGCAKIDMIFAVRSDLQGAYSADAHDIPTTCTGIPAKPGVYLAGSCSDHRSLTGTVTLVHQ